MQLHAEHGLEFGVAYTFDVQVKARRHFAHAGACLVKRNLSRRLDIEKLYGIDDRIAGRAWLVIGNIEDPVGAPIERGIDCLRDIGHMDPIENLARLDDAFGRPVSDVFQRIASWSVNAGKPQDGDRNPLRVDKLCQPRSAASR